MYTYVFMCESYVSMYIRMYECLYVCMRMYACIYKRVSVCIYHLLVGGHRPGRGGLAQILLNLNLNLNLNLSLNPNLNLNLGGG